MLFSASGRVYVRIRPKEACNPECLVPTVKHGASSVMIWTAISSILLVLYLLWMVKLLPVTLWAFQVARWIRCCFLTMQFFKMTIHTYTHPEVLSWLDEHEDALQHLLWLAQSSNLNIIEPLWSVLESRVRSRFPSSSLKQLEEEWYSIPLETIQSLRESVPRRIQAVLEAY